jgi:hypothetical protein
MRTVIHAATVAAALFAAATAVAVEYELQWDNGTVNAGRHYATGPDIWVGNDFDVSTIKTTYRYIRQIGVVMGPGPNAVWDGFRLAIWAWPGGTKIWPESGVPVFVKPTGGTAWYWFDVNWALPSQYTAFIAAVEQYYNPPNCDDIFVDTGSTRNHSWMGYGSPTWYPWPENYNVMVRVRYSPDYSGSSVAPISLGRVKALYE